MPRLVLASVMLLSLWQRAAIASVTGEAATVHAIYAKYLIGIQARALLDGDNLAKEVPPRIEISDIRTGPVSDIAGVELSSLVTEPSGRILATTPGDFVRQDAAGIYRHATTVHSHWYTAPYFTENWRLPMSKVWELAGSPSYSRYASFNVHLEYQGEERQYAALFLFGEDVNGKPISLLLDLIIGPSALGKLSVSSMVPGPLLLPSEAGRSAVKTFLGTLHGPENCTQEPVTGMCCDNETGKCGLSYEELPRSAIFSPDSVPEQSVGSFNRTAGFDSSTYSRQGRFSTLRQPAIRLTD